LQVRVLPGPPVSSAQIFPQIFVCPFKRLVEEIAVRQPELIERISACFQWSKIRPRQDSNHFHGKGHVLDFLSRVVGG